MTPGVKVSSLRGRASRSGSGTKPAAPHSSPRRRRWCSPKSSAYPFHDGLPDLRGHGELHVRRLHPDELLVLVGKDPLRAAAADPAVLLLDEITANLDAETEARVREALRQASRGRTVLSVSHRIYESLGGRTVEIRRQ